MNAGAEQSNGAGYGSEPYSPIFAVENRAVRDFICLFSKPHTVYKRIDPAGSQTRGTKAVAAGIRLCTCDPCRWRRPYFRKSAVFSNLLRNGYTDAFTWKYSENSTVRRIRYNGPTPTYAALRKSFLALSGPLSSFTHPTYTGEYCLCF